MIRQNLHTHTCYDDGKSTPMEMAESALSAGLASLGFSGHSILPYANDWAMTEETFPLYLEDVARTREEMSGRLRIYTGLEWDLVSAPPEGFDYIIGSIHHLTAAEPALTVDESPEMTKNALERFYSGSSDAFAEAYYAQYEKLAGFPFVDIVGHFDLLTKFDERDAIFDEASPRYRDAAAAALDVLCRADKLFEVNTGAMSRGWRSSPYPSVRLLRELLARRARILVTSDAHSAGAVVHAFSETEALLREIGFREIWELTDSGFVPAAL